jgi:hypothetical protein
MGNGFSGVDHEWINQNHNISLCISHGGIAGQVRWKTPCGGLKIVKAVVKVVYPKTGFDTNAWVEEESKKITKRSYTYGTGYGGNWAPGQTGRCVPRNTGGIPANQSFGTHPASNTYDGVAGNKDGRSDAQKQYSNGYSPGSGETIRTKNADDEYDAWEVDKLNSDDMPSRSDEEEMSLVEALKELDQETPEDVKDIIETGGV